jgi:hypothetical protein
MTELLQGRAVADLTVAEVGWPRRTETWTVRDLGTGAIWCYS